MLDGIKCSVDIINDVSGYSFDKDALDRLKRFKVCKGNSPYERKSTKYAK